MHQIEPLVGPPDDPKRCFFLRRFAAEGAGIYDLLHDLDQKGVPPKLKEGLENAFDFLGRIAVISVGASDISEFLHMLDSSGIVDPSRKERTRSDFCHEALIVQTWFRHAYERLMYRLIDAYDYLIVVTIPRPCSRDIDDDPVVLETFLTFFNEVIRSVAYAGRFLLTDRKVSIVTYDRIYESRTIENETELEEWACDQLAQMIVGFIKSDYLPRRRPDGA